MNGCNFYAASDPSLTPGCINISPCWFQQGREVIGDPWAQKFAPELSANLKGDHRREITVSTQRLGLLALAALRVMHPELYFAGLHMMLRLGEWAEKEGDEELLDCLKNWASVFNMVTVMCNRSTPPHRDPKCPPEALDIMMSVGEYEPAVMDLKNLGITLGYKSGTMVATCCWIVRHAVDVDVGDWVMWAWFM
ncbi:hypothetical protein AZE42_12694 [Rhizopogon vesiculosus]|uniref:2OGFeDO JBP1/TET oxygenase domain-containing protein n=1 Tax=Rhizopogon vesiculosus TaxID=180088 RepID=A0A1J8Q246_9AGAM|nr:hypothetical protein AZE42_12694 [Rhizopogon vesiculosus]